ncbi:MAG: nicotinate-nucleotide--dimethylbenzimidazole phosphoribosyltransferase [Sphingomonadales bacterium]|nr:nicotinate-nucleotide--dimethylbenzimidazole phosphoribosyltransferase [Sphingomonadales bacterium]
MPEPTAFDVIRALFRLMPEPSRPAIEAVEQRQRELTKPAGSLGRLEELVAWLAGWQSRDMPTLDRPLVAVFAGNHGVVEQGVSAYPADVTRQMVMNFSAKGAAINQICATFGLGLKVYELALEMPTRDITQEAAMEEREAAGTFAFGMEAVADGPDLLIPGDMGIGNTTIAAAIYHALYGGRAVDWVGRGAGVDEAGFARKVAAVERAVALHAEHFAGPLEVLRRLGGREIAAIAGAILAARLQRIPVILDGYVVCAAAAILHACDPHALDHCVAGHVSAEGAHREVLRRLGKAPLLDLGMRLGEASGGALAAGILKAALACHNGMSTFAEAGVAEKA